MPAIAMEDMVPETQVESLREGTSEEVDATPQEARKGWWQRRFKI